jgi:hypothetical protein
MAWISRNGFAMVEDSRASPSDAPSCDPAGAFSGRQSKRITMIQKIFNYFPKNYLQTVKINYNM